MTNSINFTLDGVQVTAEPGESIWEVAKRQGVIIPHLCHKDATSYRSDGNCRACMVEIEGERVLAASCIRTPVEGMVVNAQSERSVLARKVVIEMLVADQPLADVALINHHTSGIWQRAKTSLKAGSRK